MKMKKCELCKFPARTFCESDQASLCWDCDARVHGANFLVARHSRGLLCHTCQSLTPWRASGSKLGHTISVCERCTGEPPNRQREEEEGGEDKEEESDEGGSTEDDDVEVEGAYLEDDENEDEDDDGDGDNQVVPWSYAPPSPHQPPAASSPSFASANSEDSMGRFACSDGEFSESLNAVSLKRTRDSTADPCSLLQDGFDRPSCQWKSDSSALTTRVSGCDFYSRPVKYQSTEPGRPAVQSDSRSAANIKRFNEN
uniref:Putative zinc finger protein CONSTANS-LIKE 11 n=1 Tax=Rhizophora mucronata TaxID=61149 RepID=A0A2P2ILD7_RHIMU